MGAEGPAAATGAVYSLLLPLARERLLLPNAAVAEITGFSAPEPVPGAPPWLLGRVEWRGLKVPLVALEKWMGQEFPGASRGTRIAVLNRIRAEAEPAFCGVVLQGLPRLYHAGPDLRETGEDDRPDGIVARVRLGEETALIPDLDALQAAVADAIRTR